MRMTGFLDSSGIGCARSYAKLPQNATCDMPRPGDAGIAAAEHPG
jgi:hypothetical protein